MPRLSHTLDLDALDRKELVRSVDGVYRVLRGARFDERGYLLVPDETELERLARRAEDTGLVAPGSRREHREREAAEAARLSTQIERLREEMAEQEAEHGKPCAKTWAVAEERAVELEVLRSREVLRLLDGEHLAPGSRYLLSTVGENGEPLFSEGEQGWVGSDLTITSWDEEGVCAFEFAMREDPEVSGFDDPVTTGAVEHDRAAQTLTVRTVMRFPAPISTLKKDSALLRLEVVARIDLPDWYAALSESCDQDPPGTFEVVHPLVRATGTILPSARPDGRWSVATALEVRGRGPARPLVATVSWALMRSLRRSQETSVREWSGQVERTWSRLAQGLPALPGLLEELAEAMSRARPRRV